MRFDSFCGYGLSLWFAWMNWATTPTVCASKWQQQDPRERLERLRLGVDNLHPNYISRPSTLQHESGNGIPLHERKRRSKEQGASFHDIEVRLRTSIEESHDFCTRRPGVILGSFQIEWIYKQRQQMMQGK